MPDTGKPGYLLVGVHDNGRLSGLKATDELLKKFSSIRSDGNILPIPSMAVDCFSFPDGDVIVVQVQPSMQPPVRYRGRTWIRIGPRRVIASLDEETRTDYPKGAIRELVMNAIMHRDYQGNAPILFYQYADRLEIVNHGGLYGRARPENFPNVSDYRNPIIAEAMKVLGYVNCYNRGIGMVQEELEANGNGKAEFSFRLITAFEAKVATVANKEGQPSTVPREQESSMKSSMKSDERLLTLLKEFPSASLPRMAEGIGLSVAGVRKVLDKLRAKGRIRRVGPDKGGHWEVVE